MADCIGTGCKAEALTAQIERLRAEVADQDRAKALLREQVRLLRAEVDGISDIEMRKIWVPLSEHQSVVDERDRLLRENKKMKSAILDKMVADSQAAGLYDDAALGGDGK